MRYLTVGEAAAELRLSVPTIKRYLYEGKLQSTKLPGGQHRIPETEIQRVLNPEDTAEPPVDPVDRLGVLETWATELQTEVEWLHATV
ncbi:MAG: helix-turn-helix domain-containing protein, partial [Armatimonadetes bacterium]|nr:helix-turn-helix domain-containing protein [Armatimonadota bacterium]